MLGATAPFRNVEEASDKWSIEGLRVSDDMRPEDDALPTLLGSMRNAPLLNSSTGKKFSSEIVTSEAAAELDEKPPPLQKSHLSSEEASTLLDQSIDFRVRNTFIEIESPTSQSRSWERVASSCPGYRVGTIHAALAGFGEADSSHDTVDFEWNAERQPLHPRPKPGMNAQLCFEKAVDDRLLVPSTPETFSIGRCSMLSAVHEDTPFTKLDVPVTVSAAAVQASEPPPALSVREDRAQNCLLDILIPGWSEHGNDESKQHIAATTASSHEGYAAQHGSREIHRRPSGLDNSSVRALQQIGHPASFACVADDHQNRGARSLAPQASFQQYTLVHTVQMAQPAAPACHGYGTNQFPPSRPPAPLAPAPGTLELPSVGSAGHAIGRCSEIRRLKSR
eukprot:TRINITY_DN13825_c0_g3_i3.p1 TRINITY_DN13825_c0_g3~~TRINITY_DN13825_c0_g3_i3.p1  ORF type:complete len:394 (+),score=48.47 TRINITY_DN13825_c0_g3_i3:54-1235(+)